MTLKMKLFLSLVNFFFIHILSLITEKVSSLWQAMPICITKFGIFPFHSNAIHFISFKSFKHVHYYWVRSVCVVGIVETKYWGGQIKSNEPCNIIDCDVNNKYNNQSRPWHDGNWPNKWLVTYVLNQILKIVNHFNKEMINRSNNNQITTKSANPNQSINHHLFNSSSLSAANGKLRRPKCSARSSKQRFLFLYVSSVRTAWQLPIGM